MRLHRVQRIQASLAALVLWIGLLSNFASAQTSEPAQQYDVELIIFSVNKPTGSTEDWAFEESLEALNDPGASAAFQTFPSLDVSQLRMNAAAESVNRSSAYKLIAHIGWRQPGKNAETAIPVTVNAMLPGGSPISGAVTLVRSRFIHLKVNLVFSAADGHRYVLREQRRMQKTGEKHYLDHPYFGVIAMVTPSNQSTGNQ